MNTTASPGGPLECIVGRLREQANILAANGRGFEYLDEAADEIERLQASLALAANRLRRLSLELPHGSRDRYQANEWAQDAHDAIAQPPNAGLSCRPLKEQQE